MGYYVQTHVNAHNLIVSSSASSSKTYLYLLMILIRVKCYVCVQ